MLMKMKLKNFTFALTDMISKDVECKSKSTSQGGLELTFLGGTERALQISKIVHTSTKTRVWVLIMVDHLLLGVRKVLTKIKWSYIKKTNGLNSKIIHLHLGYLTMESFLLRPLFSFLEVILAAGKNQLSPSITKTGG